MQNITVTKIFIVLGILLFLSGSNPQGNSAYSSIGGSLFLTGALAYSARRRQLTRKSISRVWLIGEILSLVYILFITINGFSTGLWYYNPVSFIIIPLVVFITWLFAFRKQKIPTK